jgi:hypothetical protein
MESAIVGVAGPRIISEVSVKVSYSIKNGNRFIIVELLGKPPEKKPPSPTVKYIEIWEIGNVIIGIGLLQKDVLSDYVESINITIQTINECGFHITKASMEDLEWIIGENPINTFINRFSPISSKVEFAKLSIELSEPIDKEKIEKKIRSLGISEGNFLTR